MAQTNTFGKRLAGMACTTFMVTALVAQMYVNKEWAETTGLPDDIDWTATTLDNEGNIIVVGNIPFNRREIRMCSSASTIGKAT